MNIYVLKRIRKRYEVRWNGARWEMINHKKQRVSTFRTSSELVGHWVNEYWGTYSSINYSKKRGVRREQRHYFKTVQQNKRIKKE